MNLSSIRDQVRLYLGLPLPSGVRDETYALENEELNKYINSAQDELSSYIGGVEKNTAITLLSGIALYDLPDSFLTESEVRYVMEEGCEKVLVKKPEDGACSYRNRAGEPAYYFFEEGKIGFYPVPDDTKTGKEIKLYGWYMPDALVSDDDIPAYPQKYHRLIALLGAVLILETQSRFEAQSANSNISADSVSQESRTKEYSFRASELRELFERELFRIRGPRL